MDGGSIAECRRIAEKALATPQPAEARGMVEALRVVIPTNLDLSNSNVPDDFVLPINYTMGEMRAAAKALAALSATLSPQAGGGEALAASSRCPVCYDDKPHTHNAVEAVEMRGLDFPATVEAWTRYWGRTLDAALINELDFLFKKARRAFASPPAPADNVGLVEEAMPTGEWMTDLADHLAHESASGIGDGGMGNIRKATEDKQTRRMLGSALRANGAEK